MRLIVACANGTREFSSFFGMASLRAGSLYFGIASPSFHGLSPLGGGSLPLGGGLSPLGGGLSPHGGGLSRERGGLSLQGKSRSESSEM